jgi:hypothetical protein
MKAKMINDVVTKICPTTLLLNVGAIGMSLTDVEIGLKILSYIVAVLYTIIKIMKEVSEWRKKK